MRAPAEAGGPGGEGRPPRPPRWWAVDRPVFWWSAGTVFLANAGLSASEGRWVLAVLQLLTCLWAVVAGVAVRDPARRSPEPTGAAHRRRR